MAGRKKVRKDSRGRQFRVGESFYKNKGLYVYRYTDELGNRHAIYERDLVTLRKREDDIASDRRDGLNMYVRGTATINDCFDRYIRTKSELKPNTLSGYLYTYNHFVRDTFGKRKIAETKYSDVVLFYKDLLDKRGFSINTVDSVHTLLHPVFQMAVRDEIIRSNPSDRVMADLKKKLGRHIGVRRALTIEQQRAFLDFIKDDDYARWRNLFVVMFGTGMRVGELIGLRWEDIDLDEESIEVNHNVTYYPRVEGSHKCEFDVSLPKTPAGIRTIPMLPQVREAFIREKEQQELLGISCESEVKGMKGFIFCNRFGKLHNPATINREIKRLVTNHNAMEEVKAAREHREPIMIPAFSNHIARHTFCARLCEQDVNVKVIQSVMGHKDIQTTLDIYAEVTNGKKQKVFRQLANDLVIF